MGKKIVRTETEQKILGLHDHTQDSNREIARKLGISEKCVRTTIKNFQQNASVTDCPRSGRPKKTSYYDDKWIFRQFKVDPKISLRQLTSEFNSKSYFLLFLKRPQGGYYQRKELDLIPLPENLF